MGRTQVLATGIPPPLVLESRECLIHGISSSEPLMNKYGVEAESWMFCAPLGHRYATTAHMYVLKLIDRPHLSGMESRDNRSWIEKHGINSISSIFAIVEAISKVSTSG